MGELQRELDRKILAHPESAHIKPIYVLPNMFLPNYYLFIAFQGFQLFENDGFGNIKFYLSLVGNIMDKSKWG